ASVATDTNYNAAGPATTDTFTVATPPSISSLVNANHGSTAGRIQASDTITVTFSQAMKESTFCSAWTNDSADPTDSTATVHVTGNGSNNVLSISAWTGCGTFHFGSMDMGTSGYVTSSGGSNKPLDFTGSMVAYNH